jgi:N-dimethylarginine dimethylaminohydrolase
MNVLVQNEWDQLKTVVIGDIKLYKYTPEYCNRKIKDTIPRDNIMKNIETALVGHGIKVLKPHYDSGIETCRSLWVRDSATVIDNKMILLPGWGPRRRNEYLTHRYGKIPTIIAPTESLDLEGGDILQYGDMILVGLGKRSNMDGLKWLQGQFPRKIFIGINHTALHLDCCLTLLPCGHLLYSGKHISDLPSCLVKKYKVIDIDDKVKGLPNLATNIFFLDKNTIMTTDQKKFHTFRKLLEDLDYNLIIIPYGTMWRYGGGIRCLTQPLFREKDR